MKKCFIKLTVIFFFLSAALTELGAQTFLSPYDPKVVKAFADSLLEEGFLTQAEGEYKRYLFSFDKADFAVNSQTQDFQSVLLSLCNIYKNQQNKTGIIWMDETFSKYAMGPVNEKIMNLNASLFFKERNDIEFSVISYRVNNCAQTFSPDFSNLIKVSDLLLCEDIQALKELTPGLAQQSQTFFHLNELCTAYKTKSPGLALFLSAILPGSGRWYTGSFAAFTGSFLSIGSFVAGTVLTGIKSEWKSWQPYVFGACGLVLYITDLYGSYKSAQRYNDALFRHLCEETENLYETIY